MIASMTGFSTRTISIPRPNGEPLHLTMILKSFNGRYFEITVKLPYAFTHLETEVVKRIKSKLIRGTVYLTVQLSNPSAVKVGVEPSLTVVEGYLKALNKIKDEFSVSGDVAIADLINLPGIFEIPDTILDESTSSAFLAQLDNLTADLMKSRYTEGDALAKDITERIANISSFAKSLQQRAKIVSEDRKKQLLENFNNQFKNVPSELRDAQLHTLYSQLERADVHEEIVRFTSHLESLQTILASAALEKGKKIDFTIQELFREINTLSSKVSDAEATNLAIAIKVELEKIREQGQNIL